MIILTVSGLLLHLINGVHHPCYVGGSHCHCVTAFLVTENLTYILGKVTPHCQACYLLYNMQGNIIRYIQILKCWWIAMSLTEHRHTYWCTIQRYKYSLCNINYNGSNAFLCPTIKKYSMCFSDYKQTILFYFVEDSFELVDD